MAEKAPQHIDLMREVSTAIDVKIIDATGKRIPFAIVLFEGPVFVSNAKRDDAIPQLENLLAYLKGEDKADD